MIYLGLDGQTLGDVVDADGEESGDHLPVGEVGAVIIVAFAVLLLALDIDAGRVALDLRVGAVTEAHVTDRVPIGVAVHGSLPIDAVTALYVVNASQLEQLFS